MDLSQTRFIATEFNAAPAFLFLYNNLWVPLLATALYLAFCYAGPKLMRDRKYVIAMANDDDLDPHLFTIVLQI